MSVKSRAITPTIQFVLLSLVIGLTACKWSTPSVETFAAPEEAGAALQAAAKSGDESAVRAIFGPDSKEIVSSGDAVEDKSTVAAFVEAYDVMHRWRKMGNGYETLVVGYTNYPFPIPLKQNRSGSWFFDTAAGKEELLNRRVGRNELSIIDFCNAVGNAQAEYFSQAHDGTAAKQYAQKFISDPGKHNGLYWDSLQGQPQSPLGPLAASAATEGYGVKPEAHMPFHGYYFHMLKGQTGKAPGGAREYVVNGKMTGGFAFVAYPAEYGNSGVMTFMTNQDGMLFEKDLGNGTSGAASSMTEFDPDSGWNIAEE